MRAGRRFEVHKRHQTNQLDFDHNLLRTRRSRVRVYPGASVLDRSVKSDSHKLGQKHFLLSLPFRSHWLGEINPSVASVPRIALVYFKTLQTLFGTNANGSG